MLELRTKTIHISINNRDFSLTSNGNRSTDRDPQSRVTCHAPSRKDLVFGSLVQPSAVFPEYVARSGSASYVSRTRSTSTWPPSAASWIGLEKKNRSYNDISRLFISWNIGDWLQETRFCHDDWHRRPNYWRKDTLTGRCFNPTRTNFDFVTALLWNNLQHAAAAIVFLLLLLLLLFLFNTRSNC